MMWLLFAVLLVFASRADCGALKCTEGSSCTQETQAPFVENSRNDLQDDWRIPECLAGSEWESNCHSCKCSDAGRAICVKLENCEKGIYAEPMRCKPNTRFQKDCNWCDCWNGEAICTRMECYEEHRLSKRSTELPEGDECAPGSTWKSECNTCECDAKGKPVCTQNVCDGEVTEPKRTCAPNTSWRNDCNTCWCEKGGFAACTRRGCISFKNLPILKRSRVERSVSLPSGNNCAPGSTWQSACNTCFCSQNGNAACTRKECYGETSEPERSCAPRTSWKNDCNICTCNNNGQAMCTLKGCLGPRAKRSVSLPTGKQCAAGSTWKSECNTCTCNDSGEPECTRSECNDELPEPKRFCAPKTSWMNDCNHCWCSENGHGMCTMMGCFHPGDFQIQKHHRAERSVSLPTGKQCAAGSTWKSECNTCTCNDSGEPECTRRECNDELPEPKRFCAPKTSWMNDCNHCWCSDSGYGMCTLMGCFHPDFQIQKLRRAERSVSLPTGKQCAAGSTWKSECNTCTCNDSGEPECTRSECNGKLPEPKRSCAPETYWKDDCNHCRCSNFGYAMCTLKGCYHEEDFQIDNLRRAKRSVPSGGECAPGSTWKSECNTCSCTENGVVECTRQKCGKDVSEPKRTCAPGTSWKNDCNTCFCSETGFGYCTQMGCLPPQQLFPIKVDNEKIEVPKPRDVILTSEIKVVKRATRCTPGEEFASDCNTCKCSLDGRSFSCTLKECLEGGNNDVEVFQVVDGPDHVERHSVCKPGGVFYISCNACQCNEFGTDYTCLNKPCPLPKDVEVFHELTTGRSAVNTTKAVVCVANRMFIKDCNTCWCNEDGTSFYCTRRVCTIPDDDEPQDQKVTQTVVARKKRAFQEPPKQCQPGQEFRMDCNKCLCDNEGQNFSCTRIDCNALNNNHNDAFASARKKRDTTTVQEVVKCVPGSVFDRGCNVCRCSEDGHHAVCTMKRCRHDNELDSRATEQDLGFRCNPGEQFANECNDCTCSADGKSVFCTLRLCDKYISPDI